MAVAVVVVVVAAAALFISHLVRAWSFLYWCIVGARPNALLMTTPIKYIR